MNAMRSDVFQVKQNDMFPSRMGMPRGVLARMHDTEPSPCHNMQPLI